MRAAFKLVLPALIAACPFQALRAQDLASRVSSSPKTETAEGRILSLQCGLGVASASIGDLNKRAPTAVRLVLSGESGRWHVNPQDS
jgi:hypothetical protein